MKNKKPILEKISPQFGSSIYIANHKSNNIEKTPFWHFHPEIELVYVNKGQGKRHIGNHISYFNNSQLVLIGSNLAHNGFTDRLTKFGSETLIQFKPEFLGENFFDLPEMHSINKLINRSKDGLLFGVETKQKIGKKIKKLHKKTDFKRILGLLEILDELSKAKDYTILNSNGFNFDYDPIDSKKIDTIYKFVNDNFEQHIELETIANKVNMTVPAFCRYLKKVSGKTFTKIVNEYRIVHASKLLTESEMSVTEICYECGFNNFSHFNKQFQIVTGKKPSIYRKEINSLK